MRISGRLVVSGLATLLIIGGCCYLGIPKLQAALKRHEGARRNTAALATATKQTIAQKSFTLQEPVALQLPRLNINLAIKPGTYNAQAQTWSLDRTNAFVMEPVTDQTGMTLPATPVIYGHDIPAVFMRLDGIAADEILHITQSNGTTYTLRYVGDVVVKPHDTSPLQTKYQNSVLLITCTGSHFQERRIMRFELVGKQDVAMRETSHESLA